jgi:DNA-binding HxlR family transcriptional regulator
MREKFKYHNCSMHRSMGMLGTKWKPIVIWVLRERKARFGQIAATIGLISRKVLTTTLKELEEDGLIIREEHKELPPRVEYSLTEKGTALLPIMQQLVEWDMRFNELCVADKPLKKRGRVKTSDVS